MKLLQSLDARSKLVCLAVYIVVTLHARTPVALAICAAVALGLAMAVRLSGRDARKVLLPLAPILVVTVVMQVLYFQQGTVIAQLGPVALTVEALAQAGRMVASLFSVMLASVSFMRCTSSEELVRTLRWLLGPLSTAGVRTEAFMLSLSVAFRFAPVLVGEFRQMKSAQEARCANFGGNVRERLNSYARLFAPLVRSSFRRADVLAEAFVARCFACGAPPTSLHAGRFGLPELALLAATAAIALLALFV